MDKRFWAFLVVIALILAGVFFVGNTRKADAPGETKGTLTNHVEGSTSTGVKLVEYGDFQCPACGQYYAAVKQVTDKYKDQIQFQFRNFPLSSLHPNAIAGARAAEAADMQGKYWEMHNKLYEENITWQVDQNYKTWINASDPTTNFETYAKTFGLDIAKFRQDFKSTTVNDRVQNDLHEGERLGVNSTPTFFLDGKKISNPDPTLEGFSKVIDAEIAKKTGDAKKMTPPPAPASGVTDPPMPTPAPTAAPE